MNCRETAVILSAQLEGEATASQWREAERHLAECRACMALWQDFQASTALFKTKLARYEPSEVLWQKISARLETSPQKTWTKPWREKWRQWASYSCLGAPRLALGFGVAVVLLLLLAVPLLRPRTDTHLSQPEKQDSTSAAFIKPKTMRPRINRNENDPILRARLAQQVSDYFEATRLVLLEVKNNGSVPQEFNVAEIRESSQKLLEQSLLLKSELKEEQLAFLRGTVEQLEVVLFDLANLEKAPEQEEVEMLRAAIQQGDLLIKIEVIDLKALTQPEQDQFGASASRRHATKPRI